MVGMDIQIRHRKGHIIVGARQQPVVMRNVMEFGYLMNKFHLKRIADQETLEHVVALVLEPTESQNFLLGSSRQFVGYDDKVDINVIRTIARRTQRFFTTMDNFNIISTYTGFRPLTDDNMPIVSRVVSVNGSYIYDDHECDGLFLTHTLSIRYVQL